MLLAQPAPLLPSVPKSKASKDHLVQRHRQTQAQLNHDPSADALPQLRRLHRSRLTASLSVGFLGPGTSSQALEQPNQTERQAYPYNISKLINGGQEHHRAQRKPRLTQLNLNVLKTQNQSLVARLNTMRSRLNQLEAGDQHDRSPLINSSLTVDAFTNSLKRVVSC